MHSSIAVLCLLLATQALLVTSIAPTVCAPSCPTASAPVCGYYGCQVATFQNICQLTSYGCHNQQNWQELSVGSCTIFSLIPLLLGPCVLEPILGGIGGIGSIIGDIGGGLGI